MLCKIRIFDSKQKVTCQKLWQKEVYPNQKNQILSTMVGMHIMTDLILMWISLINAEPLQFKRGVKSGGLCESKSFLMNMMWS